MSYIDISRPGLDSNYETTVCIKKEEGKFLLPFFEKAYKEVSRKHEKYVDIHDFGEASEKQENFRLKYADQKESLESIIQNIKQLNNM